VVDKSQRSVADSQAAMGIYLAKVYVDNHEAATLKVALVK